MKFVKLALAVTLLQLLASCDSSQRALDETTLEAERGDVTAQKFLGRAYLDGNKGIGKGLGVEQDYAQAVKWFRKAAEQGEPYALRMLGLAYSYGEGVSRDYAQAAIWLRKAAEQGDPYGQSWLGNAYAEGSGGIIYKGFNEPQDLVLAYAWLNVGSKGYSEDTAKSRDRVESLLTPAQLAEAQRLSSRWKPGQGIEREPSR